MKKRTVLAALAVLLCFLGAVSRLDRGTQQEGKAQLEEALRRAAAACYAAEGCYPPDVEYMCRNYGVRYDEERYTVRYDVFASNLMPDITVLDGSP